MLLLITTSKTAVECDQNASITIHTEKKKLNKQKQQQKKQQAKLAAIEDGDYNASITTHKKRKKKKRKTERKMGCYLRRWPQCLHYKATKSYKK